jgi:autotransporter-associated beta strand protein
VKRLTSALVLFTLAQAAAAATLTWSGASSALWSDPENWGGTAPAAGDDLVFPAGAANLANSNDLPAFTSFNSITIATSGYFLSGNGVALGSGGIVTGASSGGSVIGLPLRLAAPQTWVAAMSLGVLGAVGLNGQTLTLTANSGAGGLLWGVVSGSGSIVQNDAGVWTLAGSNTFTGQVQINGGTLIATNANALGAADDTPANGTTVASGATLQLAVAALPAEYLSLSGSGVNGGGALQGGRVTLAGTVDLADSVTVSTSAQITFSGAVTGSGSLTMSGGGTFVLAAVSNFTGGVNWTATETLVTAVANALYPQTNIDVTGTFSTGGQDQTINTLGGSGSVDLGSASPGGTLTLGGLNVTQNTPDFSGSVTGSGAMAMSGGLFSLVGGSLAATITFTVNNGDIFLSNNATAGPVVVNGGGFSPGMGGSGAGGLSTGGLTLSNGGTYVQVINGPSTGEFNQVTVNGTVSLGSSSLTFAASGVSAGQSLTIIDNDGSDPVSGSFADLPNGATITCGGGGCGGVNFTISYTGGTGNDVVVTAVAMSDVR